MKRQPTDGERYLQMMWLIRDQSPKCTADTCVLCLVAQSCPTLCDPMDCSPQGSSIHGASPGKNPGVGCHVLLQGLFPTQGSNPSLLHCIRFFTIWATTEASVQFSHSVVSDSLWLHGLQHARFPCPSPTPGAYSNSRPSSQWCHPTIPSSVISFSSYCQSFPASGSFPMSQFFASGGQSIGASVLPMNIQDWFL